MICPGLHEVAEIKAERVARSHWKRRIPQRVPWNVRRAVLFVSALLLATTAHDIPTGVVPVDLAVTSRGSGLSASRLAIADPSAKRVWVVEGQESVARAVTRGFLRGLLGLGLFAPASSEFPTGVDRVVSRGAMTVAYDSTTQTLYRIKGSHGTPIARGIAPNAFAIADGTVAVWQNGALSLIR